MPQPHGDFNAFVEKGGHFNRQTTLAHWTGFDGTPERAGIRHDYPTYFEGYFEFFRSLMERARAVNPNAKFIVEPYDIYGNWLKYFGGDFIKSKGADAKKYAADFIWSEGSSTAFATDKRVSAAGYTCADVGNSSPSIFSEPEMRNVAALAATCGSWTSFFGRYGGYNTAPRAVSIRDIPARIKLGKLVPVWENLNNTPLEMRKYENGIYKSPTAYMSPDVYWAVQPERGRIVFVFITERGEVEIPDGWEIESLHHLDGLFGENGKVPQSVSVPAASCAEPVTPINGSEFIARHNAEGGVDANCLQPYWQFNHIPHNEYWSLTERPGAFRLHSGRISSNLNHAWNTLTQRTMGPVTVAEVTVDASTLHDGDFAGLAAFQGCYSYIALTRRNGRTMLTVQYKLANDDSIFSDDDWDSPAVTDAEIMADADCMRLRAVYDFTDCKDEVTFFYRDADTPESEWCPLGTAHRMIFKMDHFTGCRIGLFLYSTKETGGIADFCDFAYSTPDTKEREQ